MPTLTPRQRTRRVALLCCHLTRNIAYLRTLHTRAITAGQFWITVDGNFVDISVLEWCKLFADGSGKQHWMKVVDATRHQTFLPAMFAHAGISQQQYEACVDSMKAYRDKFVAHLDNEPIAHIPVLDIALHSAEYLYAEIRGANPLWFHDLPVNMAAYYQLSEQQANDAWGE